MFRYILFYSLFLTVVLAADSVSGDEEVTFGSGRERVTLIELFTSQGCSSTPPAEKYLNRLTAHEDLWKVFVPVSYHVDYWNYLGWRDPYSSGEYTHRQKEYRKVKIIPKLYTPGFMINGKPWIGWHLDHPVPVDGSSAGVLSAGLKSNKLNVKYDGEKGKLQLHVVMLGFNINTHIKRGENRNRRYRQDFIVLFYRVFDSENHNWQVNISRVNMMEADRLGLGVWVSKQGDPVPLQAAGTWVKNVMLNTGE